MQRKRELKFYATNTHQFPLILDAWLPAKRRGDHVDKFADENFSFLVANKQNDPFFEEVSLEKN
tara:strand:- start:176 stop:367 length:192 start_codon:yes stop_codon:yes gene_type:complete